MAGRSRSWAPLNSWTPPPGCGEEWERIFCCSSSVWLCRSPPGFYPGTPGRLEAEPAITRRVKPAKTCKTAHLQWANEARNKLGWSRAFCELFQKVLWRCRGDLPEFPLWRRSPRGGARSLSFPGKLLEMNCSLAARRIWIWFFAGSELLQKWRVSGRQSSSWVNKPTVFLGSLLQNFFHVFNYIQIDKECSIFSQ